MAVARMLSLNWEGKQLRSQFTEIRVLVRVSSPRSSAISACKEADVVESASIQRYFELRRRFDGVVERLTKLGKKQEADYHMIYFFLFFEEFDRLKDYIIESERMLKNDEW
jgi:hypothetical protein